MMVRRILLTLLMTLPIPTPPAGGGDQGGLSLASASQAPPPLTPPASGGEGAFAADKAPDFTLTDLEGHRFKLSEQLKKGPVLLDFWATWCKPCLQELPSLNELHNRFAEKGLYVVAITIDSPKSQSKVKPFVKGSGYDFRVLLDSDMEVRRLFGGKDVPLAVLIAPSGEVTYRHLGYVPGDEKNLEEQVRTLLERDAKTSPTPAAADNESGKLGK